MLLHLEERMRFTSPIVIVDEDADLVHATAELLRKAYFPIPVIGHSTARQAAALIAREKPSLLLCNLHMPRVGGVDLITLTRKRWGSLPTVVLVGSGMSRGNHAEGNTVYVEKPLGLDELCDRIAELPGAPPRSVPAPEKVAVPVDAPQPTAGLEPADALRPKGILTSVAALPLVVQTPLVTEHELGRAANPLATKEWPMVTQGVQALDRSHVEADLTQQALFNRIDDLSWSSETPLPPHSTDSFADEEDYRSANEILEELDTEFELVEYHVEPPSADHARSQHNEAIAMAFTANDFKENLAKLQSLEGFIGAALTDSDSGLCVSFVGGSADIDLEVAAAASTEVVRSKRKAMKALNLNDDIEDIVITLGKQYGKIFYNVLPAHTHLFQTARQGEWGFSVFMGYQPPGKIVTRRLIDIGVPSCFWYESRK